jgi:predicted small lipoprotein YifL
MRHLACLLVPLLLAQGCGIKGPLYIETPAQKAKVEERKQRRDAALQRDAAQGPVKQSPQDSAARPEAPTQSNSPEATLPPPEPAEELPVDENFGRWSSPQ